MQVKEKLPGFVLAELYNKSLVFINNDEKQNAEDLLNKLNQMQQMFNAKNPALENGSIIKSVDSGDTVQPTDSAK